MIRCPLRAFYTLYAYHYIHTIGIVVHRWVGLGVKGGSRVNQGVGVEERDNR